MRSRLIKLFSTAVRIADGAIKVAKDLQDPHSPSPKAILFASMALIKSYTASKRYIPTGINPGIPPPPPRCPELIWAP
ncbi:hypothetical protein COCNU_07G001280 [Cocos nucifera]|uniref:Uncharacterized protein n=1 Tax=Cocos nucifera TaxID=13894 RepID=A0A8K0IDJ5_COCNU|nr:hypothetical protein COCNU_07G001280 [Cocos nucifera]